MGNELTTGQVGALVGADLRGHACAVLDDYAKRSQQWASETGEDGKAKEIDAKEFQARQAALKSAVVHIDLLLKVARGLELEAQGGAAPDDEAAWEAEAARNLARPA